MEKEICLAIVSPQILFRSGFEYLLKDEADIRIIGSAAIDNGVEHELETLQPDIAIVDIDSSPDLGFDISRRIKHLLPNIGIMIFSSNASDEELFNAMKAHASAYVSKDSSGSDIIRIIKKVAEGGYPINDYLQTKPKVAEQVLRNFQTLSLESETHKVVSPLTKRETEVLQLIADGNLNKQIAAELTTSEQTIKNHVTSILRKLDANARTEAVVIAIRKGLITIE